MPDETLRARTSGVAWRDVDGEVIVLDNHANRYLSLNGSGALLWRRLVAGTDRAELVELLRTTYGVDHARALDDVTAFLAELDAQNLLDK
jgi:hypothetical protein